MNAIFFAGPIITKEDEVIYIFSFLIVIVTMLVLFMLLGSKFYAPSKLQRFLFAKKVAGILLLLCGLAALVFLFFYALS